MWLLVRSLLVLVTALPLGCANRAAPTAAPAALPDAGRPVEPALAQEVPTYRIQPGDQLDLKFFYNPELNETVLVRPDGKISLQLVDEVSAAGLTPTELDQALTKLYSAELRRPDVAVILRSLGGYRVYVGGEVNTPSLLALAPGMTPLQAVLAAGGFKETAKPDAVIVIRRGAGNRPVPIRVDLKQALAGHPTDGVPLQPADVVYVPRTWIAEANRFVNQYIERLLLFRGTTLGLGFTYELNNNNRN
ncbi:MAG: polysaccharide biosynthesis/export family protein [Candidatus Methylomirabilales bacterium]